MKSHQVLQVPGKSVCPISLIMAMCENIAFDKDKPVQYNWLKLFKLRWQNYITKKCFGQQKMFSQESVKKLEKSHQVVPSEYQA